jgi:hypothetical protein
MDKDFVKDGLTNEELIQTIKDILKRKKELTYKDDNDKFEKLKTEFPSFAERYLMLFEMVIRDGEFDWNSFNYMINMRNKIINDNMTSEEASAKVGQDWYDIHVKNKIK